MTGRGLAVVVLCISAAFLFGCTSNIVAPHTDENLLTPEFTNTAVPLSKLIWLLGTWVVENPDQNPHFIKPTQLTIDIDAKFPTKVLFIKVKALGSESDFGGRAIPLHHTTRPRGILLSGRYGIGFIIKRITNTTAILYDTQAIRCGIALGSKLEPERSPGPCVYSTVTLHITKQ